MPRYIRTKTERKERDMYKDTYLEKKEYGSAYRMLVSDHYSISSVNVEDKYYSRDELKKDPYLVWTLVQEHGDNIPYVDSDKIIRDISVDGLYLDKYDNVYEHFVDVSWSKLQYLIEAYVSCGWCERLISFDKKLDLSFSEFVDLVDYTKSSKLKKKEYLWLLNVPDWLQESVDKFLCKHKYYFHFRKADILSSLSGLLDELAFWFNNKYIGKKDVKNIINLCTETSIDEVIGFIEGLDDKSVNLSLLSTLLPAVMLKYRKAGNRIVFSRLETKPIWCDEKVWNLFNSSEAYKGAKLVHQIKDVLIQKYPSEKYFYVCMARDAVPLYNLLFESGYDSMLGVFSRSQIGDTESVNLLKTEIGLAVSLTDKKPLLVDIQGRGTIYDFLNAEGIQAEMIFGVSTAPNSCRYPVLIPNEDIGFKAIKYIEKIPQNTGRAEGVYKRLRCDETFEDTLIAWGTRDPNAIGIDLEDWEILQFRGLFMECMGVHHVHAGMVGNDYQQRLWGILKHNRFEKPTFSIGINVEDDILEEIKNSRFKTQHEVGDSNGTYDPEYRRLDEKKQFGEIGIRTVFGIAEEDAKDVYQYGNSFCKVNILKVLPYTTITPEDSLGIRHDHYPVVLSGGLPKKRGKYREIQYNTLLTWDCIVEVL